VAKDAGATRGSIAKRPGKGGDNEWLFLSGTGGNGSAHAAGSHGRENGSMQLRRSFSAGKSEIGSRASYDLGLRQRGGENGKQKAMEDRCV